MDLKNDLKKDLFSQKEYFLQEGGGIELFFSSISDNKVIDENSIYTQIPSKRMKAEELYIDFNSIVHVSQANIVSQMNKIVRICIDISKKSGRVKTKELEELEKEYKIDTQDYNFDPIKVKANLVNIIDKHIIDTVLLYIINLVANFIYSDKLELLFIAPDGVPMKAKMMEQKNRRYFGVFNEYLEKKFYKKYEEEIKKDPTKYAREELKIRWNRGLISPKSYFMDMLLKRLRSREYTEHLKSFAKNLKTYIVCETVEYGEGEKKIIDYIKFNHMQTKKHIVLYSPDSDMTILGLLLGELHVKILRYNQQSRNYDIIHIPKFKKNLLRYFGKNSDSVENKLIFDIAFIFNIFGNDFIPKIESISVKNNFELILDVYRKFYEEEKTFILKYNKSDIGNPELKHDMLLKYLKMLEQYEENTLYENYMSTTYRDYSKIKKVFEEVYTKEIKFSFLKLKDKVNSFLKNYNLVCDQYLNKRFFPESLSNKSDFWFILSKVVRWKDKSIFKKIEFIPETREKIKTEFGKLLDKMKVKPKISLNNIQPYNRQFEDSYHQQRYKETGLDPKDIFHVELYKWNNLLEPYYSLLKVKMNLAQVLIKDDEWIPQKINYKKYYEENFSNVPVGLASPQEAKIQLDKIYHEYSKGLLWTFNYYNIYEKDSKYMSNWYYPFKKAPLLKDLLLYMEKLNNNKYLDSLNKELDQHKVLFKDYYTLDTHIEFVTPFVVEYLVLIDNFDENKENKLNKTTATFNYLADLVLKKDPKINDNMFCKGALYTNKCHLHLP